ncbi:MAG TPA: serine/threonine-protein kinase, partial [Kofleriaceae bacterium]|nr:serine/threonine-protein kinase [Kofleriaceae bacterium]
MLDKGQKSAADGGALSEERLGRYELITRIADGGMAEVFVARQLGPMNFQKVVVVKKIHQNLARQKEFIGMLLDEARISALIKHPRVVDIYDLGVSRGTYFIAMEYLAGQPLSEVIERGMKGPPLDVYSTARIVADAAEGLHAAHNLKTLAGRALELVHRDVSPSNIIVLYDGGVKLVDFGVAKARGRITATDTKQIKGRVGYVAPEQIMENPVDRRSDVFSLGVVLWEALALRRLFDAESEAGKLRQILDGTPLPPSAHRHEVPYELDKICLRALSVKADDRYQTAAEMQLALEQFLDDANFRREAGALARFMDERFAPERQKQEALLRLAGERQAGGASAAGEVNVRGASGEEIDTDVRTFVHTLGDDPFDAPTNALPVSKDKRPLRPLPGVATPSGGGPMTMDDIKTVPAAPKMTPAGAKKILAAAQPAARAAQEDTDADAGDSVTQVPMVIQSRSASRGDDTGGDTGQVVIIKPRGKRGTGDDLPRGRHVSGRILPLPAPSAPAPGAAAADPTQDIDVPIDDDADDDDPDFTEVDLTGNKPFEARPELGVAAAVAGPGAAGMPAPAVGSADDESGMRAVESMIHRGRRRRVGLVLGGIAVVLAAVIVVLLRAASGGGRDRTAAAPAPQDEPAATPTAAPAPAPEPVREAAPEPAPQPAATTTTTSPAAATVEPEPEPPPAPAPVKAPPHRAAPERTRPQGGAVAAAARRSDPTPPPSTPHVSDESPAEL